MDHILNVRINRAVYLNIPFISSYPPLQDLAADRLGAWLEKVVLDVGIEHERSL